MDSSSSAGGGIVEADNGGGRKTCVVCDRPALTLDHSGDPYCAEHADVLIAIEDAPDGLGKAEITVLLVHRERVTEIG